MTTTNIKRSIALILQVAAILTYYIAPLITGGEVTPFWLISGVVNTVLFCAVFFRDSKQRVALAIGATIISLAWCGCLFNLSVVGMFLAHELGFSISHALYLYIFLAIVSVINGLANPRKQKLTA
jgi:hypothetical protein